MLARHITRPLARHIDRITPFLLVAGLVAVFAIGLALPTAAESATELLEQGIYTEQTVGDLDAAIAIYTRIVEGDTANRPHVAQARYRLGLCHLKQGDDALAREAFERLIRDFPEQQELVAQARGQLDTAQPALDLNPAPWDDGETLTYRMSLPTGKVIGTLHTVAHATDDDGLDAWRFDLYRLVLSGSNNYGVSRVLVDAESQQPIRSTVRHGVFGNADATYGPQGVTITSGANETRLDDEAVLFDNEQSLHLMRMLPLAPGYETTLRLLPTWTGQILDVGLEVTAEETCRVPAGDFACHRVELDLGQITWVSTDAKRYPLKVEHGGVVIELAKIGRAVPGERIPFGLDDFGFTGSVPSGWLVHEHRTPGRDQMAMLRFLDPEAAAISAVEVYHCPSRGCPELERIARSELEGAEERFTDYTLRDSSWSERTVGGRQLISFVGDYRREKQPWVQYRLYTLHDDLLFELILRTPVEHFESLREAFDSVAESLETE